jgi:hypothetical protein
MSIKDPIITTARDQIKASREVLNGYIATHDGPEVELLDDASGQLAEALLALDRVIGEPQ